MQQYLEEFADRIQNRLPGFISLGLMTIEGDLLIKKEASPRVDVEAEAPFQLEIVRKASESLKISDYNKNSVLRDATIESEEYTYFLSVSDDQKAVLVVMLDASKANIGITRAIIAKEKKVVGKQIDQDL